MSNQKALARKSTSTNTETQENQFEGRGFAVQKKSDTHTKKSDLNTQLRQAKSFGHSITKLAGQESSSASPVVQQNQVTVEPKRIDAGINLSLDRAIQRTIWYYKGDSWHKILETSNSNKPEFQGKEEDIYNNENGDHIDHKKMIKEVFEHYKIGDLKKFDLEIGDVNAHGVTEFGYDRNGKYQKPKMTIDLNYIKRMVEGKNFAQVVGTLRHEWEHVVQRNDKDYMASSNQNVMEIEAYYAELYDQKLPLKDEDKIKKFKAALQHIENIPEDQRSDNIKSKHRQLHLDYRKLVPKS